MSLLTRKDNSGPGHIFKARRTATGLLPSLDIGDLLAFAGVFIFTLLLYVRPNELFPGLVGNFPIVKIVAVVTAAIYFISAINKGGELTIWPVELWMIIAITFLALMFMPIAAEPQDTVDTLSDTFLKIVLIFVLMINLITNRSRLWWLLNLVLVCISVLAFQAIRDFLMGAEKLGRIEGAVGGVFANPNDLATSMDLLIPMAIVFGLHSKGFVRALYFACAVLLVAAVMSTFSRGGFLGMMAMGGVLLKKLQRNNRIVPVASGALIVFVLLLVLPTPFGERLGTILDPQSDETGSAQERTVVLKRGALVAAAHSVVGVGMGNFHIYSYHELRAHNSYLEIWAELGLLGLLAYSILIFEPMRWLRRVERETRNSQTNEGAEIHYLSVGLQGCMAAYMVCSFFTSIQYQWFLYYPVAYAVAVRRIHFREEMERQRGDVAETPGVLWSPAPKRAIWTVRAAG